MSHHWKLEFETSDGVLHWTCCKCQSEIDSYEWESDPPVDAKVKQLDLSDGYLSCDEIMVGRLLNE